ncbi:M20/M25/M40 family metallo-hydrolase, partial [Peribacillus frigoritolerans]|uniref:M20/M25/M40 family metallo-hydrolase n=1 Tax=Peribacillus frigoritolerans TaxID=450367 RepID=UPI0035D4EA16
LLVEPYVKEYPLGSGPALNDEKVTRLMDETVCERFGEESREISKPIMGSEDFSAFQKAVPGSYIGIGARNEEKGIIYP